MAYCSLFAHWLQPAPIGFGRSTENTKLALPLEPLAAIDGDDFAVHVPGKIVQQERRELGRFSAQLERSQGHAITLSAAAARVEDTLVPQEAGPKPSRTPRKFLPRGRRSAGTALLHARARV